MTALSAAARAGDPANFASAMTAASGAVDALVADVLDHYRVGAGRGMRAFDRIIAASLPAVPRVVVRRIADRYIAGER